ncbi:MAG: sugar phosphate isomerase/epimerase family protein [Planctomycetota bacterium]|jgi:sugar phosphate isomerase/epimerase
MSKTASSRKGAKLRYLTVIGTVFLFGGCSLPAQKQQVVFTKYPNLRLGFTTKNFSDFVSVSKETTIEFVDYASTHGFTWIEFRDPNATLALNECRAIANHARERKVGVGYAINTGLLDDDFWYKFNRAAENAAVFDGPRTLRAVAGGNEFMTDTNKKGWTADEFRQLVSNANKAADIAENKGLHFVIENGTEALKGDGATYLGLVEFFEAVNPNVGWQFDTANFFSGSRVWTRPEDVEAFLRKNIGRLYYIHLKTSQNRLAQPVLGQNELDFDLVFSQMAKHDVPYIAIELMPSKNIGATYKNLRRSVKYLQGEGFVSVR